MIPWRLRWIGSGVGLALAAVAGSAGEIRRAADAPQPLSPEESQRQFVVPPGFRIELVASEPLIREPTGVCWDEAGRLYVTELHGYNLEGHYDVEDLNKTGQLDREVRRIQASEEAKRKAAAGTYGTVKRLIDRDGDGRMDEVTVFADRLPPCYGATPARGGLIVVCAPDILYLADRDGDGQAEVRETLFTGFGVGALERGINAPQWGLDGWIYVGHGRGGRITGPRLAQPVDLGGTDFRLRPDGTAIEPIAGTSHTFGHAMTAFGERFTINTSYPGLYVAPLPWRYLARNPDAAAPAMQEVASSEQRVFPVAAPHPWRVQRAEDPGFFKYYRDRYGAGDSDAGGWFTSACSPLVYQDVALPAACWGHYFVCEPAGHLVHRAVIEREGAGLRLRRAPGEESREFLASRDRWFHPMNLAHGPDGGIHITDFYREIIEDYSAVPRYLQQQYGLIEGIDHGRVWRLTHESAPRAPAPDMSRLDSAALAGEVASPHFWRRETARRLLVERGDRGVAPLLSGLARGGEAPPGLGEGGAGADRREERERSAGLGAVAVLNALYTLDGLGALSSDDVLAALGHPVYGVRQHGVRLAERWLDKDAEVFERVLGLVHDPDPSVGVQLALSLGESRSPQALAALATLARLRGGWRYLPEAIVSSVHGRAVALLERLLEPREDWGQAARVLDPLLRSVAARRDPGALAATLRVLVQPSAAAARLVGLRALVAGLPKGGLPELSAEGQGALGGLLGDADPEVRRWAGQLAAVFQVADPAQVRALLAEAGRAAADFRLPVDQRMAAVGRLASLPGREAAEALLAAWPSNTPKVRDAILEAVFARRDRWLALVEALERETIPAAALTAFQRVTLLESDEPGLRERAARRLTRPAGAADETFARYAAALAGPRDSQRGEEVFRENCATCHPCRGLGFVVGPDLSAEFQRAEEAILRDILAPSETLTAGYATTVIETSAGDSVNGILASESATSLTLRLPAGAELVILRKDIARLATVAVSLMPENLVQNLEPQDIADVIAWLRQGSGAQEAPSRVMLFEDEAAFLNLLAQGDGRLTLETEGAFSGQAALAVTPLQRHAARIPGWNFKIREQPGPGEFRYLRWAWRTSGGEGVMLELAAGGGWPEATDRRRRYYAGRNTSGWEAREVSPQAPPVWRVVTVDLWADNGAFELTGLAPTAMGGAAYFDRVELLRSLEPPRGGP